MEDTLACAQSGEEECKYSPNLGEALSMRYYSPGEPQLCLMQWLHPLWLIVTSSML